MLTLNIDGWIDAGRNTEADGFALYEPKGRLGYEYSSSEDSDRPQIVIDRVELRVEPEGDGRFFLWSEDDIEGRQLFCTAGVTNTMVESVVKKVEDFAPAYYYAELNKGQVDYLLVGVRDLWSKFPILRHFSYRHLPDDLQKISKPFHRLAYEMCEEGLEGPEMSAGLRKILEGKDCCVRAKITNWNK